MEARLTVSDFEPFPEPVVSAAGERLVDPAATPDDRTYATFMHLMLVFATFTVLPLVVGPLVMWLIRRERSAFVNDHGKEALNFNISVLLYMIIAGALFACGIGVVLMPVVWVFGLVFSVVAAVAANKGEYYRYPACLRLVA